MSYIDISELSARLSDSSDPISYQYFKNLGNRTIIINEEVGEDMIEKVILPLMGLDNDGTGEEITILLNTVGGNVYIGLTLCSIIKKLKTKTNVIVLSYAMSMGALILMAGFENPNVSRKCHEFSIALIHGGNQLFEGTLSQAKDYFSFNEKYEEKIKQYILSHTEISETEYTKMERSEWYMTAEDMLQYGLVDEII